MNSHEHRLERRKLERFVRATMGAVDVRLGVREHGGWYKCVFNINGVQSTVQHVRLEKPQPEPPRWSNRQNRKRRHLRRRYLRS